MCILCNGNSDGGFHATGYDSSYVPTPQYGQGTTSSAGSTGTQNTDGLLSGFRWASTSLTFALPASAASYPDYAASSEKSSFAPVTGQLATGVRAVMSHISDYTGLTITETSNAGLANMRVGRTAETSTSHAYLPDGSSKGGDVWIGTSSDYDTPVRGDYGWMTVLHEVGHALGLKHAHSYIGGSFPYDDDVGVTNLPVPAAFDSLEYTVMSYRSYANQDLDVFDYYTNETAGYPQSLMMLDIAALQSMYGADFTTNNSDSVYTFSATTGQMSINGISEGALAGNRIFRTVWDGGGIDTYDFSNYTSNLQVNLAPGSYSLLASVQRADLGNGHFSSGNVYNALQYSGDVRSLIENAIGGSGNDVIAGNSADNVLTGGAGDDSLSGGSGNDTLAGGDGSDSLTGGANDDTFTVATGFDVITDFVAGGTDDRVNIVAIAPLSDFAKVQGLTTQIGADTIITFGFNNVVTLKNVVATALTAADFTLAAPAVNNPVNGGAGPDTLSGTGGVDSITGGTGNDSLDGLAGNDTIVAGDGEDYLLGGDGNDLLDGGTGNDILLASIGDDTLIGGDGVDYLYSGTGNNVLSGNAGLDILVSEGTNDIMNGGADQNYYYRQANGISQSFGGDGVDILVGGTFTSNDLFYGFGGDDYALGGAGNDELVGGDGNDILIGQDGNDTLDGGLGTNYLYADGTGSDLIRVNAAAGGTQTQLLVSFEGGGTNDSVSITGSTLTSFAQYQALAASLGTVISGNLLQNTGAGCVLTLNLGTGNQTDIWFLGTLAGGITSADLSFG
jgi:serralysin